jgi:acetoin utilization protein AcuB
MLVKERMTRNPVTVTDDTSLDEAMRIMKREKIRRLPILDDAGCLVGIVSDRDLLAASPSQATTLSKYEVGYLVSKITLKEVMTRDVITVQEDTPVEEVARIMADNKIGGVPVMRGDSMVGIVTETDLFKVFLEVLGAREQGLRVTIQACDCKGVLADLTGAISRLGGNIISLGTFLGDDPATGVITLKVDEVEQADLLTAIKELDAEVLDIRKT